MKFLSLISFHVLSLFERYNTIINTQCMKNLYNWHPILKLPTVADSIVIVVSPHQLKNTILRGSCAAHCLFQSLATLNLIYFQKHGILNVFHHVLDRILKGLGYAMLATKT